VQWQYVHLSVDRAAAEAVGRRKSTNVAVLAIRAGEAHTRGVRFWLGNELVWLADFIPPAFIGAD